MKNLKMILCAFVLGLEIILVPEITSYASSILKQNESETYAIGGWDENTGYYVNPEVYANAMKDISVPYSTAKHTGKAEERRPNSTLQRRAHGWTTWVGEYHYTRARMEDWGAVLTDSKRQWGSDKTEAISPWWTFNGDTSGSARTYYGN